MATEEEFDNVCNVHFKGVFFLTQKLVPLMNGGGRIVDISTMRCGECATYRGGRRSRDLAFVFEARQLRRTAMLKFAMFSGMA